MESGISLTLILVIMTGIISYQAFSNVSMKRKLIFHPVTIKSQNQFYRFITSGFIHADFGHLLINMYVLYIFGEQVEMAFDYIFKPMVGKMIYLGLYLGAIIISSVPSYFRYQNAPHYAALGASGGTSAIVFAYVIFDPWGWFIIPPLPGILMAIAYLMYSSYMDKRGGDNIGHNAHFWGAIFGFAFTITMFAIFNEGMIYGFLEALLKGPSMPPFLGG